MDQELQPPEDELPPGYRTSLFLARNFLGLFFTFYATVVSETFLVWFCMVGFGVAADLGRKKFAPELNEPNANYLARADQGYKVHLLLPTLNIVKRPAATLFWITCIYFVSIIIYHESYGAESLSEYFTYFEGFAEFMAHFSREQETLLIELTRVGFQHMVPLTNHVYPIIRTGLMVSVVLMICFGGVERFGKSGWRFDKTHTPDQRWKRCRRGILLFSALLVFYILLSEFVISEQCGSNSQMNICKSVSNYYLGVFMYSFSTWFFLIFIYFILLTSILTAERYAE